MVLLLPFIDSIQIYQWPHLVITILQFIHSIYFIIINAIFNFILLITSKKNIPRIKNDLLFVPAHEAARMIRDKEITSYKLVEAYIERQKEVNPYINAIVENNYEAALKNAKQVDEYIKRVFPNTKEYDDIVKNKPLLGVPFTLKNSIKCEEFNPIVGIVARCNGDDFRDKIYCKGVQRWKDAGAILIASTNVPELCMWIESNNKVWGRTNNPYDTRRTSGGSSGGEGAIIGAGGSLFGAGSDIAGSIRIPSAFCGIFGYKHTPRAINPQGHVPEPDDNITHMVAQAPMVRYASDLKFVTKIYMSEEERELLRMDEEIDFDKLNFFVIEDFSFMEAEPVSSDCLQAIRSVVKMIEDSNKTVVPLYFDEFKYTNNIWQATLQLYTNNDVTGFSVYMTNFEKNVKVNFLLEALKHMLCIGSNHDLAVMLWLYEMKSIRYLSEPLKKIYLEMREKLSLRVNKVLGDHGVLIVPSYPIVAPAHNQPIFARMDKSYSEIFNALGLPAIICPVHINSSGIPVTVQIVAGRNQDRLLFPVAEVIEKKFGGWKEPK
uniref:Amidase domain-containing protein n=1 Tax=Parastrongyloides trichosuri TaxID=131310 RepID=A0A0N4Z7M0_PARTI